MEQRARIILVGEHGVGKSRLAALIAAGSGLPIVEEWDGASCLPMRCIAVSNAIHPDVVESLSLVRGAVVLVVRSLTVDPPVVPEPVAEVTVTGNISDLKKSISEDA